MQIIMVKSLHYHDEDVCCKHKHNAEKTIEAPHSDCLICLFVLSDLKKTEIFILNLLFSVLSLLLFFYSDIKLYFQKTQNHLRAPPVCYYFSL